MNCSVSIGDEMDVPPRPFRPSKRTNWVSVDGHFKNRKSHVPLATGDISAWISSCSLSGSPRDGQVCHMQLARRITQRANAVSKPYGRSAVGLSARAPIMHTKMAVIISLRFYFFQFLGTIFCLIFQNPPTFEATSRRSFEGRTHPHQRTETVLSNKYNAFCLNNSFHY